jgi:Ca-activated chloride channel family protein
MSFGSAAWLWLLLVVPALAWLEWTNGRKASPSLGFSSLDRLRELEDPVARWWRRVRPVARLTSLTFLILALARPQQGLKSDERDVQATDIMLCLDVSESMQAEDFGTQTRIVAAKEAARAFVERRDHDRIGLAVFGQFAMTQCPLTVDYGALIGLLEQTTIGVVPGGRTAIGDGLATCVERLKGTPAKSKVIILLTDGANNSGSVDPVTAAKAAQSFGIKIYAVGAGAPGGGFVTVQDPVFGARRLHVAADLDEEQLTRISTATGGQYFRVKNDRGLMDILGAIDKLEKTDLKVKSFTEYLERFEWFLVPGLLLAAAELLTGTLLLRGLP